MGTEMYLKSPIVTNNETFLGVNSGFRSNFAGLKYTMIHYNWP